MRPAEQAGSPVEEEVVISQEQEEHQGGKHRYTRDQLKPGQVSWTSLYTLCLTDFGLHLQPFSISRIFLAGLSSEHHSLGGAGHCGSSL